MEEKDWGAEAQRILSWVLRLGAGVMLVNMLAVMAREVSVQWNLLAAYPPGDGRWAFYVFAMAFVADGVLLPVWFGLANRSLESRARPELKSRPLMATFWFYIPGAFLFMPWAVVREVYLASKDPDDWHDQKAPVIIGWWLARLVFYVAALPLSQLADPQDGGLVRTLLFQGVIAFELAMEILLVTRITRWQAPSPKAADLF